MSRDDRPDLISPSACRCMNVRAADSARDDFHVNIVVAKWLGFELLEFRQRVQFFLDAWREMDLVSLWTVPLVRRGDGKAFKSFGIHLVSF
jgi:hypothetical protein